MKPQKQPGLTSTGRCNTCAYKATEELPAGRNSKWECSHPECPHRRNVTAAPREHVPLMMRSER